ncbi:MAG: exodeoxyribonuclease V subunit alpha, partial [Methylococcaceae bacterium]
MSADEMLDLAFTWQEAGYIRPMDVVFAEFIHFYDKDASPLVLLAVALASNYYGKGHSGVNLAELLKNPETAVDPPRPGLPPLGDKKTPAEVLKTITLDDWRAALEQSRFFAKPTPYDRATLPCSYENSYPLVLDNDHVYLARNWINEQWVARSILERANTHTDVPDATKIKVVLDRLFSTAQPSVSRQPDQEPNWQKIACAIGTRGRILIMTGGPGTGKTYTIVRLLALLQSNVPENEKLRILLAAPTGKAAARLTESIAQSMSYLDETVKNRIPTKAVTLHQLLGASRYTRSYQYNEDNPIHADVVVVDEASMIDLEMMASLLRALPDTTRLILVGDKDQLASVEAGSVMGDLCSHIRNGNYTPDTLDWMEQTTGETLTRPTEHTEQTQDTGNALAQQTVQLVHSMRYKRDSGIGYLSRAINAGHSGTIEGILKNPVFKDLNWWIIQPSTQVYIRGIARGFKDYLNVIKTERP